MTAPDPIWRPGGVVHAGLVTWLDGILTPTVVDTDVPGAGRTPVVALVPTPSDRRELAMTGPDLLHWRLRAVSMHDTAGQARALGDLVRDAIAGKGTAGAWVHAMTLTGCTVVDRLCDGDGYPDNVGGVQQWTEGYTLVIAR